MNNTNYPPYYHSVFVKYRIKGTNIIKTQKMWLAVNDRGKYIWTNACNNIHVWTDDFSFDEFKKVYLNTKRV